MQLSKQDVSDLGQSALMQDLGMNQLPAALVSKPTPLTAGELASVYHHPLYGRDLVARSRRVSHRVAEIIVQGHERLDGSGYPRGLAGDRVSPTARVLAVADVYAALVSARPYRPALDPYQAMVTLVRHASHGLLDREVVRRLIECLSLFPVGSLIRLETGEVAKVVSASAATYTRPKVRVLIGADGQRLERPYLVDLAAGEAQIASPVPVEDYPELSGMAGF
jgi:HD-GYP domain-containing protein (c-di-GMP phosphodiesterase class II)